MRRQLQLLPIVRYIAPNCKVLAFGKRERATQRVAAFVRRGWSHPLPTVRGSTCGTDRGPDRGHTHRSYSSRVLIYIFIIHHKQHTDLHFDTGSGVSEV